MGLENTVLLGRGQPCIQRQDLQARLVGERISGVPDLPLAAEEDQDVARPFTGELGNGVGDGLNLVARLGTRALVGIGDRPVTHLDRVRAARTPR